MTKTITEKTLLTTPNTNKQDFSSFSQENFTNKKTCKECRNEITIKSPYGICFICHRETPEYKNHEVIKKQKDIELYSQKQDYFQILFDNNSGILIYDKLLKLDMRKKRNRRKTKYLIGLDYFMSVFYYYKYNKFNKFDTTPKQKNLIKGLIHFESGKISKERMLELLFWDLAEYIEDTDIIEDICSKIDDAIPSKKNPSNSEKIFDTPPKTDKNVKKTDIKNHNFQYDYTFSNIGKLEFDTLSMNLREGLRSYRRDIYDLLKVRNYYVHDFKVNYYFLDGYLEKLKNSIKLTKFDFITLRFCKEKLTITFNRDINEKISCKGFVLDVLRDFISIGIRELYVVLANYGIAKEEFENNLRAKTYTRLHLAKDINRNIKRKQPELYYRLRLNQDNDMESLCYIGLNYWSHYIDYSKTDIHGNKIPEYELQFRKQSGISFNELEQNLLLLEPNIIPKQQTIYRYLNKNNSYYNPIDEFSIEPNKCVKNDLSLENKDYTDLIKNIVSIIGIDGVYINRIDKS